MKQSSSTSPSALCTGIKAALRSADDCTCDTVSCLARMLMVSPLGTSRDSKRLTTHTSRQTRDLTFKTSADLATSYADRRSIELSRNEKLMLATEAFNLASKAISDHLKTTESSSPRTSKLSSGRSPLKVTSSNKRTTRGDTIASDNAQSKREDKESDLTSGIVQVAQCARIALTALLELQQRNPEKLFNEQLEQGFSVLIGKLLALRLHDAALSELARQGDRIANYLHDNRGVSQKQSITEERNHSKARNRKVPTLLTFGRMPKTKDLSALMITFQHQVLKAILARKRPTDLQDLSPLLIPSNELSPASVILNAQRAGFIQKDKATQQLQILAHTVAYFSSLAPRDDDGKLTNTKVSQYVDILDLQIASLEIKSLAWSLAGHKCDEIQEIWEPLARYFVLFARRCTVLDKARLEIVKQSYVRLKNTLKLGGYRLSSSTQAIAVSTVLTILGQIAQLAAAFKDAAVFYDKSLSSIPPSHPALIATCHCRIALLHVATTENHGVNKSPILAKSISDAADCLAQSLKGSQAELDELMIESAKLKKAVMNIIASTQQKDDSAKLGTDLPLLVYFVRQFVRVLRRYIGQTLTSPPPDETNTQSQSLFQSRLTKFQGIISSAIDSTITIGKLSLGVDALVDWEGGLASLADCLALLEFLRRLDIIDNEHPQTKRPLGFVKLSNLYWSRYLKVKASDGTKEDQISILEQCIAILQGCPTPERYQGFLGYKLERLASLFLDIGQIEKATSAFRASVEAYIDAGTLRDAAKDASSVPLGKVLKDSNGSGYALHRALGHFVKLHWRSGDLNFVMDADLRPDQRVILLESQLLTIMELVVSKPNDDHMDALSVIVHTMMGLYPIDQHPIRRARVCLHAVRFALNSPGKLDEELFKAVIRESEIILTSDTNYGEDHELAGYRPSIWSSLHFFCAMCFGHLSRENLETVIQGWLTISQECNSWNDVCLRTEEPKSWITHCQTIINYLEVRGFWQLRLSALSALSHVLKLDKDNVSDLVACLTQLGLQYSRLGLSKKAAVALAQARSLIEGSKVRSTVSISWHLAFAELAIEETNLNQAWDALRQAKVTFDQQVVDASSANFSDRTQWERLVADATAIYSKLALCAGNSQSAILFAKLSVKLNNRIWARLDRYSGQSWTRKKAQDDSVLEGDSIDEKLSRMSLSKNQEPTLYREGCTYWQHFFSHFSSLLHLSRLSARYGLYQDTIYFADQAHESALGIGSTASATLAKACLGEQYTLAGNVEKGKDYLSMAFEGAQSLDCSRDLVAFYGRYLGLQAVVDPAAEQPPFQVAHKAFESLLAIAEDEPQLPTVEVLGQRLDHLAIEGESDGANTRRSTSARSSTTGHQSALDPSLLRLRGRILRQEAETMLLAEETSRASSILEGAETYPKDDCEEISDILLRARLLLIKAELKLSSHAVYCVLSESTYSVPSILEAASNTPQPDRSLRTRNTRARSSASNRKVKSPVRQTRGGTRLSGQDEYSMLLSAARDLLMGKMSCIMRHGSTGDNLQLSHLLSRIQLMESATSTTPDSSNAALLRSIIENSKQFPFLQETAFISADKKLSGGLDPLTWPVLIQGPGDISSVQDDLSSQCIERLPDDWSVVSLTLSSDQNEMIITRLQAGEEPFVLRLPLKRSNAEDADDEEAFGFAEGKAEIIEIIHDANRSAHDTRARNGGRDAKKEWWANREFLDNRIKDFLKNIETLWFGGFRGVFLPKLPSDKLFVGFSSTFERILNKHLPSRRQRAKQKQTQLKLDPAVLDLFLKLDNLKNDEDPEEIVMDLLYFVVDILQFRGERNAYDEIDFDQMVVEVMDAIKVYSEASAKSPSHRDEHIILVLDKELHVFPWESMDFLKGASISRVPSLQCVIERLSILHANGAQVGRNSVSYVLNPGGDLKSTQVKFQPVFSSMPGWSGIVGRGPTEEEFQHALESSEVVLYFGHGSGAQYIRGRTIRRLDQCAVTFLMGCSSGVLTEARDFEPYGTPMNYMHAGAGALVATLWDVTDKDIDRFTKTALENWGLVPSTKYLPKSRAQQGRRLTDSRRGEDDGSVGLDSAISRSREACIFKYLNGAAPVVYGIPIFVK